MPGLLPSSQSHWVAVAVALGCPRCKTDIGAGTAGAFLTSPVRGAVPAYSVPGDEGSRFVEGRNGAFPGLRSGWFPVAPGRWL